MCGGASFDDFLLLFYTVAVTCVRIHVVLMCYLNVL